MKKKLAWLLVAGFVVLAAGECRAISAWSRKYGADCSMCHWKQNKLNATGKDFLRRGHRMPDESQKTKDGGWANISDYISITQKTRYDNNTPSRAGFYVEALSLYAGGPIDDKYSFFYEQYLHENKAAGADREKLAEAYLMMTSPGDEYYSFRIGQIAPFLLHTAGTGGRLPISRPYVLESGTFATNNPYAPRARQYGVEVAANKMGMYSSLSIVNGTGQGVINPAGDTNAAKDIIVTLDKNLDDNGSNIGLYYYLGKWSLAAADAGTIGVGPTYVSTDEVNFNQVGVLGNWTNSFVSLVGGALVGQNAPTTGTTTNNMGYYLEGDLALPSGVAVYSRYDNWDRDTNAANVGGGAAADEKAQIVAGLSFEPMEAGRIALEGQSTRSGPDAPTTRAIAEFQYMY